MRLGIEAVTICARLPGRASSADILAEVAPLNRPALDRWIVVTTPEDSDTKRVCRQFSIECIESRDYDLDPPFAKAAMINKGLQQCRGNGWLLHMDADIALPIDFHQCLHNAQPQKGRIHGCLRQNVIGSEQWDSVKNTRGAVSRHDGWLVDYGHQLGLTVGGSPGGRETGYVPLGFFQLWHASETLSWGFPRRFYPEQHGNAARTDVMFAAQWDRRDRILIPELVVFHLESERAVMGANWNGRTTKPFRSRSEDAAKPSYT